MRERKSSTFSLTGAAEAGDGTCCNFVNAEDNRPSWFAFMSMWTVFEHNSSKSFTEQQASSVFAEQQDIPDPEKEESEPESFTRECSVMVADHHETKAS